MPKSHIVALLAAFLQQSLTNCVAAVMSSDLQSPLKVFSSRDLITDYNTLKYRNLQQNMLSSPWMLKWDKLPNDLASWVVDADLKDVIPKTFPAKSQDMQLLISRGLWKRHVYNAMESPTKSMPMNKRQMLQIPIFLDDSLSPADGVRIQDQVSASKRSQKNKNSITLANTNDNYKTAGDSFTRSRKGRLGRMPMAFGKRNEPELPSRDNENYLISISTDAAALSQNTSEKQKHKLDDGLSLTNHFYRVAKSRLLRMPVAFGKRSHNKELYQDKGIAVTRSHVHHLASPGLAFSKQLQSDIEYGHSSDQYAKGNSNLFTRVSKGSLNRMPLSFGKRVHNSILKIKGVKDTFFQRMPNFQADSKPVSLMKRESGSKYQALFHILKSKINTLNPETQDRLISEIQQLLDQLLSKDASLTRLTRSKLERMPINFGKRINDPAHVRNYPSNIHYVMKRSALYRMPISFGRRGILAFKSAKSLKLHQKPIASDTTRAALKESRIVENLFSEEHDTQENSQKSGRGSVSATFIDGGRQSYLMATTIPPVQRT